MNVDTPFVWDLYALKYIVYKIYVFRTHDTLRRGYDVVIVSVCTGMSEMFQVFTIHKCVFVCAASATTAVCSYCMFDVDIFAPSHVGNTALTSLYSTVYVFI